MVSAREWRRRHPHLNLPPSRRPLRNLEFSLSMDNQEWKLVVRDGVKILYSPWGRVQARP